MRKEYKQASVRFALTPLRITWRVHGRTQALVGANQSNTIPKPRKDGPEIPSISSSFALFLLLCNCNHSSQWWRPRYQNHGGFFWVPNWRASLFLPKILVFTVRWYGKFTERGTGFLFEGSGCDNNNVCVYWLVLVLMLWVLLTRLMNLLLSRIHLPHQWLGSCTLRRMSWHAGK